MQFLAKRKYELLLAALIQHLFSGIYINNFSFYTEILWPINMVLLGIASIGVFLKKGNFKNTIRNILFFLVVAFPVCIPFFGGNKNYMVALNITFVLFYILIFWEIFQFLIRPGYINADIISACACGYLLLIEIGTFTMQIFHRIDTNSFKGINTNNPANTFMDFVYFITMTITSIGFGDITPNTHHTKLMTSLFGITGQFYSVVLVGIIISKFSSKDQPEIMNK